MFGFKKRSTSIHADSTAVTPEFIEGYTQYGFATHVMKNEEGNWTSLCDKTIVKKAGAITPEQVVERLPRQHDSFFYCGVCGSKFTGVSEDEIRSFRKTPSSHS